MCGSRREEASWRSRAAAREPDRPRTLRPVEAFRSLTSLGAEAAQPQDESEPTQSHDATPPGRPGDGEPRDLLGRCGGRYC